MVESGFDRSAFEARLSTQWLGRHLIARAALPSTNDAAWEALEAGAPDGVAVVADAQTKGRGRAGRSWHTAPGKGLALSVGLRSPSALEPPGTLPLLAGLALTRGLEHLGAITELKWPNDVLIGDRKLAGILCECRRLPGGAPDEVAYVIGAGVNVSQEPHDFPPELRGDAPPDGASVRATSLAIEGHSVGREAVAAELLNALEPLWVELGERGPEPLLGAWRRRASIWGRTVRVRTPSGPLEGRARTLDAAGGLVVDLAGGASVTVLAGDLELAGRESP